MVSNISARVLTKIDAILHRSGIHLESSVTEDEIRHLCRVSVYCERCVEFELNLDDILCAGIVVLSAKQKRNSLKSCTKKNQSLN